MAARARPRARPSPVPCRKSADWDRGEVAVPVESDAVVAFSSLLLLLLAAAVAATPLLVVPRSPSLLLLPCVSPLMTLGGEEEENEAVPEAAKAAWEASVRVPGVVWGGGAISIVGMTGLSL